MATRQYKKSRLTGFIVPTVCLLVLAYFIYHAQAGKYGIHAMRAMEIKSAELKYQLAEVKKKHQNIKHKVSLLTDGTITVDALDENARKILGLAKIDELVIFYE